MSEKQIESENIMRKRIEERHQTLRWFWGCFTTASIICSIVWAIALCTLESYKHPVQFDNKVESSTKVNRN